MHRLCWGVNHLDILSRFRKYLKDVSLVALYAIWMARSETSSDRLLNDSIKNFSPVFPLESTIEFCVRVRKCCSRGNLKTSEVSPPVVRP